MEKLNKRELDLIYYPYHNNSKKEDDENEDDVKYYIRYNCCHASVLEAKNIHVSNEVLTFLKSECFKEIIPTICIEDEFGDNQGGLYAYNPKFNKFVSVIENNELISNSDSDSSSDEEDEEDEEEEEEEKNEKETKEILNKRRKIDTDDDDSIRTINFNVSNPNNKKRMKLFKQRVKQFELPLGDDDDDCLSANPLAAQNIQLYERVYWIWLHYRYCNQLLFEFSY